MDVAYDPRSPYEAVLSDSVPQGVARIVLLMFGLAFIATGISNAWRQYRYERK